MHIRSEFQEWPGALKMKKMRNLKRSLCSTCKFLVDCSLTTNHNDINSCSEYVHQREEECAVFEWNYVEV